MYNKEIAERKERNGIIIIVGSMVVFILWTLINTHYNQPEKVFSDCVDKYQMKITPMPSNSNNQIKISCCLRMDYVPMIDVEGKFFACANPATDDAIGGE